MNINQTNLLSGLLQNSGIQINTRTRGYVGVSTADDNFTPGVLINSTLLNEWHSVLVAAYQLKATQKISPAAFQSLFQQRVYALTNSTVSIARPYDNRFGFLREIALAAHKQFNWGSTLGHFLYSFGLVMSNKAQQNELINTLKNSMSFMQHTNTGMTDLITGEVSAINASLLFFGQDLIVLGRAINLQRIDTFGLPSSLYKTLLENNAVTQSVVLAMLGSGLTMQEIKDLNDGTAASKQQERKLLEAFKLITSTPLNECLLSLNCQTIGITALSELLEIKKLFPNSYTSMLFQDYTTPVNSKCRTAVSLYVNGMTNQVVMNQHPGAYLYGIFDDVFQANACGGFAHSMQQVKKISSMKIEKFAQVVSSMETVTDLSLFSTNTLVSPSITAVSAGLAIGSGQNNTIRCVDMFGAMSGIGYDYERILENINALNTNSLRQLYAQFAAALAGHTSSVAAGDALVAYYMGQINAQISALANQYPDQCGTLNALWQNMDDKIVREYYVREKMLQGILSSDVTPTTNDIIQFVTALQQYAKETNSGEAANVLECIADQTTFGGQALIAAMRTIRNGERMAMVGGELDTEVSSVIESPSFFAPTKAINVGNLTVIKVTGDPTVDTINQNPLTQQNPEFMGSLAGSEYATLLQGELDLFNSDNAVISTAVTPEQGLKDTTACNCDF
jgi:hypothetical protein